MHRVFHLTTLVTSLFAGNTGKWLCAERASGFLYARPELQNVLDPLVISWGWEAAIPRESQFLDYCEWSGTHNPASYLATPAAIEWQAAHNWPAVRAACHELLLETSHRIAELSGLPQISPDTTEWWSQMRTISLPPCNLSALKERLWDEFQVEVPMVG